MTVGFSLGRDIEKGLPRILALMHLGENSKAIDLVLEKEHNYPIIRGVDQILIFVGFPTPPGCFEKFNTWVASDN